MLMGRNGRILFAFFTIALPLVLFFQNCGGSSGLDASTGSPLVAAQQLEELEETDTTVTTYESPGTDLLTPILETEAGSTTETDSELLFTDKGDGSSGPWKNLYFKDGKKGKIENTKEGLLVEGASANLSDDGHVVLWTKASFQGPVKITFDYQKKDAPTQDARASVVFIHGRTANKPCPVDNKTHPVDIQNWKRQVADYTYYTQCMDNQSVNFDSSPNGKQKVSFRQNSGFTSLQQFTPAKKLKNKTWYKVVIQRNSQDMQIHVSDEKGAKVFQYKSATFKSGKPLSDEGYFGLRSMVGRKAVYRNIKIYRTNP